MGQLYGNAENAGVENAGRDCMDRKRRKTFHGKLILVLKLN